jgi:hypothetical protein
MTRMYFFFDAAASFLAVFRQLLRVLTAFWLLNCAKVAVCYFSSFENLITLLPKAWSFSFDEELFYLTFLRGSI